MNEVTVLMDWLRYHKVFLQQARADSICHTTNLDSRATALNIGVANVVERRIKASGTLAPSLIFQRFKTPQIIGFQTLPPKKQRLTGGVDSAEISWWARREPLGTLENSNEPHGSRGGPWEIPEHRTGAV